MRGIILLALIGCRADKVSEDTGNDSSIVDTDPDVDNDGYAQSEDCDDNDPQIHPGATEICDGVDNDCDDEIDEGVETEFFEDADSDGFGSEDSSLSACEAPSGYVSVPNDCNDENPESYPGAAERCDGEDNDCDGSIDEDVQSIWYADADSDGFGNPDMQREDCDPPAGHVADDTDCDDLNAAAYPGATEVCDEADNDCNGSVDEGVTDTFYQDADDDNWGVSEKTTEACTRPSGYAAQGGDCDDATADVHPAATEVCDDIDNDCDGGVDESDAADAQTWYADSDGDGHGDATSTQTACDAPTGYVDLSDDCDDGEPSAHPGATEVCDTVDNDCDGDTDEDTATDASTWYADHDGDGYGGTSSTTACDQPSGFADNNTDCDDDESSANPGATEVCDDIDNDCDGDTDEGVTTTYYADDDGDGFGDAADSTADCSLPGGYVTDATDCDDLNAAAYPGATEVCDEADNDCDGDTDEGVTTTYYADSDSDGHGNPDDATTACSLPSGYVLLDTDCDDSDAMISPNGVEVCDGADNDCDGSVDGDSAIDIGFFYADSDGDGYGTSDDTVSACDAPSGYVNQGGDCDDSSGDVNPDEAEICNSIDDNCDGVTDSDAVDLVTYYADGDGDGYGLSDTTTTACSQPSGYAAVDGDCNDASSDYSPGADPGCDGEDYDCDGLVDNDGDGDGYAADTCGGDDCNDDDASLFPSGGVCVQGTDCLSILNDGLDSGDGIYTIDPDGSGTGVDPFDVSCDMTTDGGGWTMMLHLYDMSGLDEDEFIATYGHNLFTDESWHYDGSSVVDGLASDGLVSLTTQGAVAISHMDGLWDDLRMTCSTADDDDTESHYIQVDGYATTNSSYALLGAASNGTAYSVDSATNSYSQSTIWHDNETSGINSGHYLCDTTTGTSSSGTTQFGFCYTDFLNNPNSMEYGDSIVSIAFGTSYGSDSWSDGFTVECGNMTTTALQNAGTVTIWVR